MYIARLIFLKFLHTTFMNTYVIIPIMIPFAIEYVKGIMIIHTNAGIDSE